HTARARPLVPLAIRDTEWILASNGEPAAAPGLRMPPRDLAKIGQLVPDRGRWSGRQLVPADWLEASFTPRAPTGEGLDYGYQWWLGKMPDGRPWIGAFGNGGQSLSILQSLDLAVVVIAGTYNAPSPLPPPI